MRTQGLDISDSSIRFVVLDHRRGRWQLPIRAEIPVPFGAIVDGELRQPDVVVPLLQELFSAAGIKSPRPVVSLPERHTFIKLIPFNLADSSPETVEPALANVAEQHLPYPLSETIYDWEVLPQRNSLGELQIVVGAAPKTLINSYLDVLDRAHVTPASLGIESLAMTRATFRPDQEHGTHILLDLGRSRSTLTLVQDGVVQFSTTVRYAGKELNQFIAHGLGITEDQAERAKTLFGLDPARGKGILRKVLAPQIDNLATKVAQLEDFFSEHFIDHQPVKDIALTGSGAMMRNIDLELGQRLSLPVHRQPSWVYEELRKNDPNTPEEIGLAYATALGLALEHQNI